MAPPELCEIGVNVPSFTLPEDDFVPTPPPGCEGADMSAAPSPAPAAAPAPPAPPAVAAVPPPPAAPPAKAPPPPPAAPPQAKVPPPPPGKGPPPPPPPPSAKGVRAAPKKAKGPSPAAAMAEMMRLISGGNLKGMLKKTVTVDKSSGRAGAGGAAAAETLPLAWSAATEGACVEGGVLSTYTGVVQAVGAPRGAGAGVRVTYEVGGDSGVVTVGVVPAAFDMHAGSFLGKTTLRGEATDFAGVFLRQTGSLHVPGTPEPFVSNAAQRGLEAGDRVTFELQPGGDATISLNKKLAWKGKLPPLPERVTAYARLYRLGDTVSLVQTP